MKNSIQSIECNSIQNGSDEQVDGISLYAGIKNVRSLDVMSVTIVS